MSKLKFLMNLALSSFYNVNGIHIWNVKKTVNVILLHESVCVCARIGGLTGLQNNIQVNFKILKYLNIEAVKGFL